MEAPPSNPAIAELITESIADSTDNRDPRITCLLHPLSWRSSPLTSLARSLPLVHRSSPQLEYTTLPEFLTGGKDVHDFVQELVVGNQDVSVTELCAVLAQLPRLLSLRLDSVRFLGAVPNNQDTFTLDSLAASNITSSDGDCTLSSLLALFPKMQRLDLRRIDEHFVNARSVAESKPSVALLELTLSSPMSDQLLIWATHTIGCCHKLEVEVNTRSYDALGPFLRSVGGTIVHLRIHDLWGYCNIG